MPITRSRVIAGASGLAGEPPDEPLPNGVPMWLRFEQAADLETEFLRDLNLSDQNRTMAKMTLQLQAGQREIAFSQYGLENPAFISLSSSDHPDSVPESIDITNIATVDQDAREGKRTIAPFGDKPQRGLLSWKPTGSETLTVWFDKSPNTDPSADQSTFTITDSYVPLLKLQLAAVLLELMKQPIGEMLKGRIQRGMQQWRTFVESGRQQGVVKKSPSYPSSRTSGPEPWWNTWPGRIRFE